MNTGDGGRYRGGIKAKQSYVRAWEPVHLRCTQRNSPCDYRKYCRFSFPFSGIPTHSRLLYLTARFLILKTYATGIVFYFIRTSNPFKMVFSYAS